MTELVKENEMLQGRLSDMKVTLQENKSMMHELMQSSRITPKSDNSKSTVVEETEPSIMKASQNHEDNISSSEINNKTNKLGATLSCTCRTDYEKIVGSLTV